MSGIFTEEVIWIVGCSAGIGKDLAISLAASGASIILSARSKDQLELVNKKLVGSGHLILPLDISNIKEVAKAVKLITTKYQKIDRVIFMAGIYEPTSCNSMDINKASQIIDINLKGVINIVHFTLPILEQQSKGQIVLCASIAGYFGLPNGQPYSASKAGIINLAESLRCEYDKSNIDVKVINPGFVKTRLTDKNKFSMPFIMDSKEAALAIIKGIQKKSFEIHFPKKLTIIFKILRILPFAIYFWLVKVIF
ncbi:MAG: SDR family NAD(P)-dependent oxidoreductase [Rickettsiaceae bacterium]|nr:SDR family NAD(P)-dependent oxidoreductase [Rickettsiaceae bacterium]